MNLEDVISNFNTTPFLFVGSGITRRYLNLPDWRGLLSHFASLTSDNEFAYSAYENLAARFNNPVGLMPKVADLIQTDFNKRWFEDPSIRTLSSSELDAIKNGGDPFKFEIASYIKKNGNIQSEYIEEIELLKKISGKNISGVITTNYDTFLEDSFDGYKKYVGQKQLIFSSIQGIAEIYKIHGSVESPDTIVINETDYQSFMADSAYLAAKLMTIFMEYPIIFIGYSISDSNIQEILKSIVHCLDAQQIKRLEDRFVFVEYQRDFVGVEVTPQTIVLGDKQLTMQRVRLENFSFLYSALEKNRSKLPVRLLRRFKEELYDYTITNVPTSKLRVASIEDNRVSDEELVLAIGKASELGIKGLSGIDGNEWYRNIIMEDIDFSADDLLQFAFPSLIRKSSGTLPVNKYLALSKYDYPEVRDIAEKFSFDKIISNTLKKNRTSLGSYCSVNQIWNQEKSNLDRATRLIACLPESQINSKDLFDILKYLFEQDINILDREKQSVRTNIRRLIRIYDYLMWGKKGAH